jgi:hypothetical protein
MQSNSDQFLTQDELVTELHQLGYSEASATSLAAWRKLDLLPQFSSRGQGQGRGAGREKSHWCNPPEVINQAVAIMDLRKNYPRLEELYLPLWQLGFPIPSARIRPALTQPLVTAAKDLYVQEDGRSATEDVIDQAVADISPLLGRKNPLFNVPDDSLAAVMNVLANTEYNFGDQPYEDGVVKLQEWERSFAQRCETLVADGVPINPEVVADGNNIFAKAPFINQYLSLPRLMDAAQNCTDEELVAVQRDLQLGREILLVLNRVREWLTPFLPEAFCSSLDDITLFLGFGRLMIWIDLALRRQGFGPTLDQIIPSVLNHLHLVLNEVTEREIRAAGPEIGRAVRVIEQIMITGMSDTTEQELAAG